MKKQILIFTFFTLAFIFAGMNTYGQYQTVPSAAPTCLTPKPLANCSADELHPAQGVEYTYTVTSSAATNDVRWFVVNNADLKDGTVGTPAQIDSLINTQGVVLPRTSSYIDPADGTGDYILSLGSTHNTYNVDPVASDGTGTDHSIEITWKYFDGKQPNEVLLVAYVVDDAGCTDNIAVYRVIPEINFTLDVAALGIAGDSIAGPGLTGVGPCVSPIQSATYASADNVVGNGTLTVDYGENWIYFIVNAANFKDSWMPTFQISNTGGAGITSASWTYIQAATNASATWNTLTDASGTFTSAVPVIAGGSAADGTPTNAMGGGVTASTGGECIVVRVRIDYGTLYENATTDQTVTFAVNGVMYDGVGSDATDLYNDNTNFEDLHHADCTADGFTNDVTHETITVRPEVTASSPTPFETKTGDGN